MPRKTERFGAPQGLGSILEQEKRRIYDDAAPAKREAFLEAERAQEVYRAWNTVCARTREGQHVCGLHFVPETRELIVYVDGSSWVNELTVLREIIRARMEACGVSVSALVFKLSRKQRNSHIQPLVAPERYLYLIQTAFFTLEYIRLTLFALREGVGAWLKKSHTMATKLRS